MIVKAWIDNGIINCMSQKCTSEFIKDNHDDEISMCPRIAICKEYKIIINERVFKMRNKLNIGDEVIVRLGENVIGNGEKGRVTGMNIFQDDILYNIELERGFDNGGCLPIQTLQVKNGQYEPIYDKLPETQKVRCKFTCTGKSETGDSVRLDFVPAYAPSEENKNFFKWTPGGKIELQVVNPNAAELFETCKEYYVDFTAVE